MIRPLQVSANTGHGQDAAVQPTLPPPDAPGRNGARPVRVPPLRGAARGEIAQRARKLLIEFLMDHSGSMYWALGDPSDTCGAAAESLIDLQRRSGGGRAMVVPWGTHAPANLVAGPHDVRTGRKELARALRVHSSLGGNDLPAALRRAAERMPALAADESALIFVITDGIETVTPAMHHAVAALPVGSVHMCLIDRNGGCTDEMENAWRTVAFGSFTRLDHLNVASMTNQLVSIYANALGLTSTPVHPHTRSTLAAALTRRNS